MSARRVVVAFSLAECREFPLLRLLSWAVASQDMLRRLPSKWPRMSQSSIVRRRRREGDVRLTRATSEFVSGAALKGAVTTSAPEHKQT